MRTAFTVTRREVFALVAISLGAACSLPNSDPASEATHEGLGDATGSIVGTGGKCMDAAGGSSADGTPVQLYDCNGTAAQSWTVSGDRIQGPGGKCLDARNRSSENGTLLQLWTCAGGENQKWSFANGAIVGIGRQCVDDRGFKTDNGNPLQLWHCYGSVNQKWELRANGGSSPPPSPPPSSSPPIGAAFYVATDGSDTNPGTLSRPFATLRKAQTAMQASSSIKTTYIRSGNYNLSQTLNLGSADDNETWSYYPPDGPDRASISGGSTKNGSGLLAVISVSNTDHVTIDGLTIRDFQYAGIDSGGGTNHLLVQNSVLFNGYTQTNASNPGGISCYGCANTIVSHNVFHDIAQFGVSFSNVNGDISNLLITGNVFYNTCNANADCGAVYVQDTKAIATNVRLMNNYVHDGNTFAGLGSGYGAALYADDCTSNVLMAGNVITGRNGANTTMVHGGSNVHQTGNLVDLANLGQHVATFQASGVSGCSNAAMSNNEYTNNVVISAGGGGGFALLSGSPQHAPSITDNDYWNYGGTAINSGAGSYRDVSPAHDNPNLSGWDYEMPAGNPVLAAPVSFPRLVSGWGPPGYALPKEGTPPSSPH